MTNVVGKPTSGAATRCSACVCVCVYVYVYVYACPTADSALGPASVPLYCLPSQSKSSPGCTEVEAFSVCGIMAE